MKNTDENKKKAPVSGDDAEKTKQDAAEKGFAPEEKPQDAVTSDMASEDAPPDSTDESPCDDSPMNASLRIQELEKQQAELQDQLVRKAADFDNYRKRMIREKQEAIDFANTVLLTDLVQILDDFDRAIDAGVATEDTTAATAFADGVVMIRKQLGSLLETKYGMEYYPSKDQLFDPHVHEAIGTQPDSDITEPTVAEEYLKGYKLKGRVIRLAKVMVKMPPEAASE